MTCENNRSARPQLTRPKGPFQYRTAGRRAFSRTALVTQRHTVGRHHLEARPSIQRRLDWSAGGPCVAGRGSCRGSIQRRHGHIMLELARDMRQMRMRARSLDKPDLDPEAMLR